MVVDLASGARLYAPGAPIEFVYFPDTAVASMVRHMKGGSGVEVGTIGADGMVGVSTVLGAVTMPAECIIQVPGVARKLATASLLAILAHPAAMETGEVGLAELLRRFAQSLFEQVAQSAACNRLHALNLRCARWLLMTHDRVQGDEIALTQEFLSYMLGVRRAGVTEAMGALQRSGLIRYRHGHVTVCDRPGLEAAACECYGVGVAAYNTLLGGLLAHAPLRTTALSA